MKRCRVAMVLAAVVVVSSCSQAPSPVTGESRSASASASTPTPLPTVSATTSVPVAVPSKTVKSQVPSQKPSKALCSSFSRPFVPSRITVDRLKIDAPVTVQPLVDGTLSVPLTGAGVDPEHSFAWQKDNPRVGAPGLQFLATHTYIGSIAVGNVLGSAKPRDIIKVYGGSNQVACYQVLGVLLYPVAKVPASLLDAQPSDSELLIEFCWDYNSSTNIWEKRKYVKARLIQ